ncbi:MAG: hypothetical protein JO112_01035 [Planctomycetes bacterium]|nr:hypothetical protein [Planctomycetota bacterium]
MLPQKVARRKAPAAPPGPPATSRRRRPYRMAAAALISTAALMVAILSIAASLFPDAPRVTAPEVPPPPPEVITPAPLDEAAVRARAWERAQPLLAEADRQAAAALDRHLDSIHAFLADSKPGARAFAERLLSLRGKWELVRSQMAGDGQNQYAEFLSQAFAEHVFAAGDLEQVVAAAIQGYLAELEGIEDQLLVRLRADLADDQLAGQAVFPDLASDQAFRSHYHDLALRVAQDLDTDLKVVAGREVFLWEATNVATDLTLEAGAAAAARLGISSTILSAGATSSWRTLGVGLVVAIVLDAVVNRFIKAAGYDAEAKIAEHVGDTLDDLGRTITDGSPEARATLEKLQTMEHDDPDPDVRAACTQAIHSIQAGTQLYGLRRELDKITAARASLRKETLRRFIYPQETHP